MRWIHTKFDFENTYFLLIITSWSRFHLKKYSVHPSTLDFHFTSIRYPCNISDKKQQTGHQVRRERKPVYFFVFFLILLSSPSSGSVCSSVDQFCWEFPILLCQPNQPPDPVNTSLDNKELYSILEKNTRNASLSDTREENKYTTFYFIPHTIHPPTSQVTHICSYTYDRPASIRLFGSIKLKLSPESDVKLRKRKSTWQTKYFFSWAENGLKLTGHLRKKSEREREKSDLCVSLPGGTCLIKFFTFL